ncbi:RNA polymerase sigma factor [Chitinophaga alhagiae]|uniref:RNA polymerase sigma factor n=1 Tax=Chitinophaga alhagiae TaxID=2203219 RepID=UPI000E5B49E9|nr:sigma-70 family RNA polymerase sigma factor [Chitinophaga alhagiae]
MSAKGINNERELLKQVAGGSEKAFQELMAVYQPLLLTFVFRLTRSAGTAEEIVQDVFLKIWMGREALADVQRFKSYLFTVCRNYALDQLRKLMREQRLSAEWEQLQPSLPAEETVTEPDAATYFFTLLDEAVAHLPPQQQKVYILSRRNGLTHAEISKRTSLSVLTVKKYMKLAIAAVTAFIRSRLGNAPIVLVWLAASAGNFF